MSISKLIHSCAITALLFISGCGGGGNEATVSSNKVANDVTLPAGQSFLPFPNDFVWGSATAANQVEGGRYDATGKALRGDSIWDFISQMGINGDVAIDQYNRYQEDVALMAQAGMKAYRFSISWPRLFKDSGGFPFQMKYNPQTKGFAPVLDANGLPLPAIPNPEAVAYYNNLIDELKANGIEPYITLFHWDLPIAFESMGGFESRQVTDLFQAYAATVFGLFGQKVTHWTTLNEPCTYTLQIRGRFKIAQTDHTITNVQLDLKKYYSLVDMAGKQLNLVHNYLLAHAKAVQVFHKMRDNGLLPANSEIGLTLDLTVAKPASNSVADVDATRIYNDYKNGIFTYPVFQGKYPDGMLEYLKSENPSYVMNISDAQLSDDLAFMKKNQGDFVALNYYSRPIVSKLSPGAEVQPSAWTYDRAMPFDGIIMKDIYVSKGANDLENNNGSYDPQGFYDTIKWLYEKSGGKKILITENGSGNNNGNYNQDILTTDGKIHDSLRTRYLKGHIQAVWKAINEGIPVIGYFEWSLFDNFEWFTYFSRFGSIYIDYNDNLKRYPKDSYYFLQKTIKNNGVDAE